MKNLFKLIILFSVFISCKNHEKGIEIESSSKINQKSIISVSEIEFDTVIFEPKLKKIEEINKGKWMSQLIDNYYFENKLYSAYYYSIQPKVNQNSVYVIYSIVDDNSACYLITTDQNENFIDYKLVSDSYSHFAEDSVLYVEIEGITKTYMELDSIYLVKSKDSAFFDYKNVGDTIKVFEKSLRFLIDNSGKIIDLDSTENIKKYVP